MDISACSGGLAHQSKSIVFETTSTKRKGESAQHSSDKKNEKQKNEDSSLDTPIPFLRCTDSRCAHVCLLKPDEVRRRSDGSARTLGPRRKRYSSSIGSVLAADDWQKQSHGKKYSYRKEEKKHPSSAQQKHTGHFVQTPVRASSRANQSHVALGCTEAYYGCAPLRQGVRPGSLNQARKDCTAVYLRLRYNRKKDQN